jgi:hypothetical protein
MEVIMKTKLLVVFTLFCFISSGQTAISRDIWPTNGWPVSTLEEQGLDSAPLTELNNRLEAGESGYIDEMLIIRNGHIVFEKSYEHDYDKINSETEKIPTYYSSANPVYNYYNTDYHPYYKGTKLHTLQSCTKTISSLVIGIAVGRKAIHSVDVNVLDYFKDQDVKNVDERKRSMTIEDLLTMRAGLEWDSKIPLDDPKNSAVQLENSEDWIDFVINQPMVSDPGTVYEYCGGATMLLSYIIKKSTGMHMDEYANKYMFQPLGIKQYYWKKTPKQLTDAQGGLYLEPRDLAKFGYLFLKDGIWDGKRILPDGWIQASTTPHVKDTIPNKKAIIPYGYQLRLLPIGGTQYLYIFHGFGGQKMLVIPKYGIIATFNAWNIYGEKQLGINMILSYLKKALK